MSRSRNLARGHLAWSLYILKPRKLLRIDVVAVLHGVWYLPGYYTSCTTGLLHAQE